MANVKEEERTPAVLEEMLRDIKPSTENPTSMKLKDVLREGIENIPAPMVVSALDEAGYTRVYHTKEGDTRIVHKNLLKSILQKKNDDGSYAFSPRPVRLLTKAKANLNCLLHINDLRRAKFEGLGLPVCDREGIPSPYQQRMHMIRKHKQEWAIIEQEREEREKQEQKEWQQNLLSGAVSSPRRRGKLSANNPRNIKARG